MDWFKELFTYGMHEYSYINIFIGLWVLNIVFFLFSLLIKGILSLIERLDIIKNWDWYNYDRAKSKIEILGYIPMFWVVPAIKWFFDKYDSKKSLSESEYSDGIISSDVYLKRLAKKRMKREYIYNGIILLIVFSMFAIMFTVDSDSTEFDYALVGGFSLTLVVHVLHTRTRK